MYLVNLLFIPLLLVSLYWPLRLAYLAALGASLAAAVFIHSPGASPANILLTIAIFNLTPLALRRLDVVCKQRLSLLKQEKAASQAAYERMVRERSLIKQDNFQLNKEVSGVVELYKVTRDMSAALGFPEICKIFGKKLMENFHFKRCRLAILDEDGASPKINSILELQYGQSHVRPSDTQTLDDEILKQALRAPRIARLKEMATVAPVLAQDRLLGTLAVEDLPDEALDNFSILFNQFSLEFKRVRLYKKIQKLSITDGLTGLFVRRYFMERLDEEIKRSLRHGLALTFLMVDVDHFKACNDNYGHLTGDMVLREVAKIIKANVREIDLVGRYGGEEFALLLPDTDKLRAIQVAERIRASIDEHRFRAYDETIKTEVSIGVADLPEDSAVAYHLIDRADQALYRAKQQGRNRVVVA